MAPAGSTGHHVAVVSGGNVEIDRFARILMGSG
jgi:hypothetical protein